VIRTEDSVDIFVSADNRKLGGLIVRAQRRDAATVDAIKDFYLEHISFYAMLAELDSERVGQSRNREEHLPEQAMEQEYERELARACETLCGVVEDLFELVAGRSQEEGVAAADQNPFEDERLHEADAEGARLT